MTNSDIEWKNTHPTEIFPILNSPMNEEHGRHGREYWHGRSKFLSSYHFEEKRDLKGKVKKELKDKMKRSVKAINGIAMGLVSGVRHEMSRRRVGIKVYRFTEAWPSMVRCFVPWSYKDHHKYLN